MRCGTRVNSYDTYEIARNLESEGEHSLAQSVRRGDCLDSYDLRRAEDALERQGLQKHWDYTEDLCHCSHDDI
jgi:hypothetical protein